MTRIWFLDGAYMDVLSAEVWMYETQPDWDRSERLPREENGKHVNDVDSQQ